MLKYAILSHCFVDTNPHTILAAAYTKIAVEIIQKLFVGIFFGADTQKKTHTILIITLLEKKLTSPVFLCPSALTRVKSGE